MVFILKDPRKKEVRSFIKRLRLSQNEKDVEHAWQDMFRYYYEDLNEIPGVVTELRNPHNTDGFLSRETMVGDVNILMEFKHGTNLDRIEDKMRIIAQLVYYMRKFKEHGDNLPNILVGADESQAFVLYAPNFYDYLDRDTYQYDTVAPSEAYKRDLALISDLMDDHNTQTWTYHFNGTESEAYGNLTTFFKEINQFSEGHQLKIIISPSNIANLYEVFKDKVYKDVNKKSKDSFEEVGLFMQLLKGDESEEYYPHPKKPNTLVTPSGEIQVDSTFMNAFFKRYDRNLGPSQLDELTAIADRLIEDEQRRFTGDFWTPTIWALRADEMMRESIADNYKTDSLIWDPAAGTSNLTRDFSYSDLYVSTLHQPELDLGMKYNPEAKEKFQYDFLNDDVHLNPTDNPDPSEWKMPETLFNALIEASQTGKRVIFYSNPPYGTANNADKAGGSKKGMANTSMSNLMKQNKWGQSSQQLYAQFFARTLKIIEDFNLKNVYIAYFTNTTQFNGGRYWRGFNEQFMTKFEHHYGNVFKASEFSDTSDTWAITFSIYKQRYSQISDEDAINLDTELSIEQTIVEESDLKIEQLGVKTMRSVNDDRGLNRWVREPIPKDAKEMQTNYPYMTSAFNISQPSKRSPQFLQDSLGYMFYVGNNVGKNAQEVSILTSSFKSGNGFNILPINFERSVVGFSARRVIESNWMNNKDNYTRPDTKKEGYEEFVNDSLVYSIFDNNNFETALRDPKYSNTNTQGKWANQWFWMTLSEMQDLANTNKIHAIYDDTRGDEDRYVAKQIQARTFSEEAQKVLDLARQIVSETMPARKIMIQTHPKFYLQAWDAGWYQIKKILDNFPLELKDEFDLALKELRSKIEEGVYEYDMLVR